MEAMDRRRAVAIAVSATLVILAAVLAVGATFGLFGLASADGGPGTFDPVSATTVPSATEQTVIVDVPISGSPPASGATSPTPVAPAAAAVQGPAFDDDGDDLDDLDDLEHRNEDDEFDDDPGSGDSGSDDSGSDGSDDSDADD